MILNKTSFQKPKNVTRESHMHDRIEKPLFTRESRRVTTAFVGPDDLNIALSLFYDHVQLIMEISMRLFPRNSHLLTLKTKRNSHLLAACSQREKSNLAIILRTTPYVYISAPMATRSSIS